MAEASLNGSIRGLPGRIIDSSELCVLENPSHGEGIVSKFARLKQEGLFCDITLVIDGHEFEAHRMFLAAMSPYFEALFSPRMKEGSQSRISILDGFQHDIFKVVLDFCYTGQLRIQQCKIQDVIELGNFLNMPSLCQICCNFILEKLDGGNVVSVILLADSLGFSDVLSKCCQFCLEHFCNIELLSDLPGKILQSLSEDNNLFMARDGLVLSPSEQECFLFQAILSWLRSDTSKRSAFVGPLLASVRWSLITEDQFVAVNAELEGLFQEMSFEAGDDSIGKTLKEIRKLRTVVCAPRVSGLHHYQSSIYANYETPPTRTVVSKFDDGDLPKLTRVVGMKIYGRRWDGRHVIGGLKVYYSNGESRMHGSTDYNPQASFSEFVLDPDESIISIDVQSGWLVDGLTFHTNKNRVFGPFGGDGGGGHVAKPPDDELYPYLAYVKGVLVRTNEEPNDSNLLTVAKLQFVWGSFKYGRNPPKDENPIPIPQRLRGDPGCGVARIRLQWP